MVSARDMDGRADGQRTHGRHRSRQGGAQQCRRRRRQQSSEEVSVEPPDSSKRHTWAIREHDGNQLDDTLRELRPHAIDFEAECEQDMPDMAFHIPPTAAERADDVPDCPNLDEYDYLGETTCTIRWVATTTAKAVTTLLRCARSVLGRRRVLLLLVGALFVYAMITRGQWRRNLRGDSLLADSVRLTGYSVQLTLTLVERTLLAAAKAVGAFDTVVGAVYCDLASALCDRFDMLCSDKCSFVQAALGVRRPR
jgi:hypothetical protein